MNSTPFWCRFRSWDFDTRRIARAASARPCLCAAVILAAIGAGRISAAAEPTPLGGPLRAGNLMQVHAASTMLRPPGGAPVRLVQQSLVRLTEVSGDRLTAETDVNGRHFRGGIAKQDVDRIGDPLRAAADKLAPLCQPKRAPADGDWLDRQKEAGQTFDQYLAGNPNRPNQTRTTLYVQPIGDFDPASQQLVRQTEDFLGRFYNIPVKELPPIGIEGFPESATRTNLLGERQLLTTYVLEDLLPPKRPKDAVAVLGLTATDLWPGAGWNFVFGQASLTERVGVWSIARYRVRGDDPAVREWRRNFLGQDQLLVLDSDDDVAETLRLLRTLKVATHETGHMLGIQHCTAYECGMNGSNSLDETDRGPLPFCPHCSAKIWWACGADPQRWFAGLAEFGEKHKLAEATAFWKEAGLALRGGR